ncbi:AKAP7, partial [Branchiostoma lanceolatum]
KESQSPSTVPSKGQKSKRLQQRTTQVTNVPGTEAALCTAVKEHDPVLTDRQEVLDVEMEADPPTESDVQTTDAIDVEDTEKTARIASEDDEDDGTYDLTDLFDEEKQRAAWEEESQQPSKLKKKKKKKAKWWERKRKRGKTGEAEEDVEEGEEEGKVKKKKKETRPRPNYFVAIRVSNEEIHRGLKAVQEAVLDQEKNLLPAMIPLINMHITLLVTHLTEEQLDRAKEALRLAKARLNPRFLRPENRLLLTFHGLGTFRNDVVFAKIQDNDHLTSLRELAETVQTCFVEKEVCSKNDKGFEPHLTLMKTSRNFGKLRSKGIKKIDPKLYEEFKEQRFGEQVVKGLQLCSMLKRKEADGYYHTEEQVMFGLGLEHIVANSIASRAVREALLQLGCKLLEQQAKSNPEAALHTLSDHIARSVIQDALTALEVDENVINNKEKVFSTDIMKAKVLDLSESLGTALVNEAIQEASCKSVENYKSNKENEKNVDNVVDCSENVVGNSRASTVTKSQSDLSGESVKDQEVNIAQTQTGESCVGVDEDVSSCKTSEGQLKDLSEKLVKEIIEAAMSKVQETEGKK